MELPEIVARIVGDEIAYTSERLAKLMAILSHAKMFHFDALRAKVVEPNDPAENDPDVVFAAAVDRQDVIDYIVSYDIQTPANVIGAAGAVMEVDVPLEMADLVIGHDGELLFKRGESRRA